MKKYLAIILAAVLLLSLAACTQGEKPATGTPTDESASEAPTEASSAEPTPEPAETEAPTPEPTEDPDPLDAYEKNDYESLRAFFELTDE
ncbi:MAG: hypothetical protein II124_05300, partial [Clostridia bacterium]|nr:hypothetical protein [Clostridia bacterium]